MDETVADVTVMTSKPARGDRSMLDRLDTDVLVLLVPKANTDLPIITTTARTA